MNRGTQRIICASGWALIACTGLAAVAQELTIERFTIGGGGRTSSTSGDLELFGTMGEPGAGAMSGGDFTLSGGFLAPFLTGDCDGDGDVDLDDHADLVGCMLGPAGGLDPDCDCFDLKANGHVDLADYAAFQVNFTGG